jgi:GT2 family glycosyltransferase
MTATLSTTIGIVTHNRHSEVSKLLKHLVTQTTESDSIIIIDNGVDKANTVYQTTYLKSQLKKHRGNSKYIRVKEASIPKARNSIIRISKLNRTDLLIFIDDDCIPHSNWLDNIKKYFSEHESCDVLQGYTISTPQKNLFAKTTNLLYLSWFKKNTNQKVTTILDTKNCGFRVKKIPSKLLVFNKKIAYATDIELGIRLNQNGFKIHVEQNCLVQHKERTSYPTFIKHRARSSWAFQNIQKIHKKYFKSISINQRIILLFIKSNLRLHEKVIIFSALVCSYTLSYIQLIKNKYVT